MSGRKFKILETNETWFPYTTKNSVDKTTGTAKILGNFIHESRIKAEEIIPIRPQPAIIFADFDDGVVWETIIEPVAPIIISQILAGVAKNPNRSGSKWTGIAKSPEKLVNKIFFFW